uniref:Uncharacterized protein n=1 Tax=Corethron hystrix TaxID=216773 RepID=A0A7S1BPL0_9STRA
MARLASFACSICLYDSKLDTSRGSCNEGTHGALIFFDKSSSFSMPWKKACSRTSLSALAKQPSLSLIFFTRRCWMKSRDLSSKTLGKLYFAFTMPLNKSVWS